MANIFALRSASSAGWFTKALMPEYCSWTKYLADHRQPTTEQKRSFPVIHQILRDIMETGWERLVFDNAFDFDWMTSVR